ncbi:MAG TPA: DUF1501 domain-containing protein [Phaeodactylibacter sp.]|nr:DUF1501 domain-containing protein [Phaeodactylibacter sp.]
MKRRTFIKRSSAAVPVLLGGVQVSALNNSFFNILNTENDKVLVLIQLDGGNDGLNMLIPKDQYDNLAQVRSNIIVPENSILDLTDTLGFHPVMGDLKTVFDDGKLNIIQSVGYPNQNRSHFRSTDIWTSGSSATESLTTGWFGRYLENLYPDYPMGYPNAEFPAPFAITIGSSVSPTCEGSAVNYSTALVNPDDLSALATPINGTLPDTCFGSQMEFLAESIVQTNAFNDAIQMANDNGNNLSTKYEDDNRLANKLKIVAKLIAGGLQTKLYVVTLGGFDNHADQVVGSDTMTGKHAELLKELSDAICAFQDDLSQLNLEQRVVGMTFSEFGRRIRSNDSLGTDHGTAAPMMLFGSCVNPIVLGNNPEISTDVTVQEGVSMQYDFRSVYGSILMDWFEVGEQVVKDLLYDDFQHLPILTNCQSSSAEDILQEGALDFNAYPNPFNQNITIDFTVKSGWVKISLFDAVGHELKVLTNRKFSAGKHTMTMEGKDLASGSYYYRIQTDYDQKTKRIVKL